MNRVSWQARNSQRQCRGTAALVLDKTEEFDFVVVDVGATSDQDVVLGRIPA